MPIIFQNNSTNHLSHLLWNTDADYTDDLVFLANTPIQA